MKSEIERRKPEGFVDYLSLAVTTVGVGYLPLAPGTWGSMVGVLIYIGISFVVLNFQFFATIHSTGGVSLQFLQHAAPALVAWVYAVITVLFLFLCIIGIWASGRSAPLFGNADPSQPVLDEVAGHSMAF